MKNHSLIEARKRKGLTQQNIADAIGCRNSSVSNWENGHSNPSLSDAIKVATILGTDVEALFLRTEVQETHT